MSHYLVELYHPNATWQALPVASRENFIDAIRTAMADLAHGGVRLVTLSETDANVDHASKHGFLGIWQFPDRQAREVLLAGIKQSGWYDYFDHVNAAGDEGGLDGHLDALINA